MIKTVNSTSQWKGHISPSTPVERISPISRVGVILPALPARKSEPVKPGKSFQELLDQALAQKFDDKTRSDTETA